MIGHDGISRAIYVTATGQRVVIVRAFVKKTQQTPRRELYIARQGSQMIKFSTLHKKWMKDSAYRKEYDALEEEFALIEEVAKARQRAGLSQAELARRMNTTQSTIARLESGRGKPSTRALSRFAKATGHRLKISFEPVKGKEHGSAHSRASGNPGMKSKDWR